MNLLKDIRISDSLLTTNSIIKVLKEICDYFCLGNINQVREIGGVNKNFVVITDCGEFVIKIISHHQLDIFKTELIYLKRLEEYCFPIPCYLSSPNGYSAFQSKRFFAVAMRKSSGIIPKPSSEVNQQIGFHLAQLHNIPIDNLPKKSHWLNKSYLPQAIKLSASALGQNRNKEFTDIYKSLNYFNPDKFPQSIIHGDLHPYNCLFIHNKLSIILDWEDVGIGACILDFAWCVLSFCFIKQTDGKRKFDITLYKSLLEGYVCKRTFTSEEKWSINDAIKYMRLTFCLWIQLRGNLDTSFLERDSDELCCFDFSELMSLKLL